MKLWSVGVQLLRCDRSSILNESPHFRWKSLTSDGNPSLQMEIAAEQAKQADHDQINGNDIVQQARHSQDQNACDKRYERADTQVQVHDTSFLLRGAAWQQMREIPRLGQFSPRVAEPSVRCRTFDVNICVSACRNAEHSPGHYLAASWYSTRSSRDSQSAGRSLARRREAVARIATLRDRRAGSAQPG